MKTVTIFPNYGLAFYFKTITLSYERIVQVKGCIFIANGNILNQGHTWVPHTHFVFIDQDGIPFFRISSYNCWFKFIWGEKS